MSDDKDLADLIELARVALDSLVSNCIQAHGDKAAIDANIRTCATSMATAYYQGVRDALNLSPAFCEAFIKAVAMGAAVEQQPPESGVRQ
jgi:hypothetical protein